MPFKLESYLKDINSSDDILKYFPSLKSLKTTPQDNYYHGEGDVFTHTLMVLDELVKLPSYYNSTAEEQLIMFYAALFHDIAKPICTKIENDKITSKGHSAKGAVDARILMYKKYTPFNIRESICNIIANHQVPFFAFNDKPTENRPQKSAEYIAISLSHQVNLKHLITVAKADMLGRKFEKKQDCMDDICLFEELVQELGIYESSYTFASNVSKMKYFDSYGAIPPDMEYYDSVNQNTCKILCGLPGSGKSYFRNNSSIKNFVSFDDTIEELNLKRGTKEAGKAVQVVYERMKEFARSNEDFIFDSTNISKVRRNVILNLCKSYNIRYDIEYFEVDETTANLRILTRNNTLSYDKVKDMMYKWEVPTSLEAYNVQYYIKDA